MTFVTYRITGVTPLLQHNPQGMQRQQETDARGNKFILTGPEEAEVNAYRAEDGSIYHPSSAFRSALLAAAKGHVLQVPGQRRAPGAAGVLSGILLTVEEKTPLLDPNTGERITTFRVDTQRVVIQRSAVLRSRPRYEPWGALLAFEIEDGIIPFDVVDDFMSRAGRMIGVGDFRPERKGPFGKFTAARESTI